MRQRIGYTDVSAVVQPDVATSLKNEMTTPSNAPVEPGLSAEAGGPMVHTDHAEHADHPKRSRSVTRDRLLDAAGEVFAERGVAGASVEEVCERAGYTRGAFYSNFATKDELVVALLDREEGLLLERLSTALGASLSEPAPLTAIAGRLFDLQPFGAQNYALRAELSLLAVRDPELAAPYPLRSGPAGSGSFRSSWKGWPKRGWRSPWLRTTRWTPSTPCSRRACARRSSRAMRTPETTSWLGCCRCCSGR